MDDSILDDDWAPVDVCDVWLDETFLPPDDVDAPPPDFDDWAESDDSFHLYIQEDLLDPQCLQSQTKASLQLRDRALFYEGDREAAAMALQREATESLEHRTPADTPDPSTLAEQYPYHTLALQSGVRIRMEGRPSGPLIAELIEMRRAHGPLVFVRLLLPELDGHSMVSAAGRRAVVQGSRNAIFRWASVSAKGTRALTCALQRDAYSYTHCHFVLPLNGLSKRLQDVVSAAPQGKDGGVLLGKEMHAVVIGDTSDDLEGVARYLCKYPDERSRSHPDDPEWLSLAEEIAENMQYGEGEQVKLCWRRTSRWRPGRRCT